MRRGCMSVGGSTCDNCGRVIKHPGNTSQWKRTFFPTTISRANCSATTGTPSWLKDKHGPIRLSVDCTSKKGYESYQNGKSEKSLTIFEKRAEA